MSPYHAVNLGNGCDFPYILMKSCFHSISFFNNSNNISLSVLLKKSLTYSISNFVVMWNYLFHFQIVLIDYSCSWKTIYLLKYLFLIFIIYPSKDISKTINPRKIQCRILSHFNVNWSRNDRGMSHYPSVRPSDHSPPCPQRDFWRFMEWLDRTFLIM